mgnify:CR=1 FL=1
MNIQSVINKLTRRDEKMLPNICYSQNGEDLILKRLFQDKCDGFYIDIGAHHPVRFSNTYLFYRKGWCGINIDATPGSMQIFNKIRKRDINIEIGISSEKTSLLYYEFNDNALNTFDKNEANLKVQKNYKIVKSSKLNVDRLENILEKHMKVQKNIDFMNIDVEGKDKEVLISNNWEKFRPKFILIETLNRQGSMNINCDISDFLNTKGYSLINKAYDTCIFKEI